MKAPAIEVATDQGRFEPALESAPVGMWDWRLDGHVLTLSPSCLALAQIESDDTASLAERVHPEDRERLRHALAELATDDAPRFVFRFRVNDRHFEATALVERDGDTIVRLSGWVTQTTQSPGLAETVLDALPNPVFVKDEREHRWIGANQAFASMLGRPVNEILGHRDHDFLPEDQADHFVRMDDEVFEQGVGIEVEEPITVSDGATRWLFTKKTIAKLPNEERVLVGVITDITERKRSEEALERAHEAALEASRTKSRFLANMSHEIRTPLNGVLGMIESIDPSALQPREREAMDLIRSSGNTLLSVINDILDFSKIEAGRMGVEHIEFSPRDVTEDVTRLLSEAGARRNLDVTVDVHEDVPAIVIGDPTRVRQVLFNLIGNGIKFTTEGAVHVEVSVAHDAPALDFAVYDTGKGIAEDRLADLFEAFVQADDSTTRHHGGTGLGLSISKQLAELMGGDLFVRSELGVGSHFTLRLPCEDPEAPPPPERLVRCAAFVDIPPNVALPIARRLVASGARALAVNKPSEVPREADVVFVDGREGVVRAVNTLGRRDVPVPLIGLSRVGEDITAAGIPLGRTVLSNELQRALHAAVGEDAPPMTSAIYAPLDLRVLVAEDNGVNQLVARRLLAKIGVVVDIAEDGAEAVEAAKKQRYDAVLMDCQMPRMDGYEATIAIRQIDEHYARIPIIALTASALGAERERCFAAGMSDHIAKPIRLDELYRVLASWCRRAA
ncbi:MAG: ATP-binding protein [Deltaproteobacteria bacterium]|jgi:two-component system sensor histidine kinase/response regulator